jgi:uncharacterized protein YbjT (DUF2867 family)
MVYELTGPEVLDIAALAERYGRALGRPIVGQDLAHETWEREVLAPMGLPDHVRQHIATMAVLHRAHRYERATNDVERVLGRPGDTVEQFVAAHRDLFD